MKRSNSLQATYDVDGTIGQPIIRQHSINRETDCLNGHLNTTVDYSSVNCWMKKLPPVTLHSWKSAHTVIHSQSFHQSGMNSGRYLLNGKVETYLSTTFRNTKLDYWIIYIYYTKKQKISALLLVNGKNSWKWISGSTISSLHLKKGEVNSTWWPCYSLLWQQIRAEYSPMW